MPPKLCNSEKSGLSRRQWLGRSLAATAAIGAPAILRNRARGAGANDEIGVAVAGLRLRGAQLIQAFRRIPGVRVTGLCDEDREILDKNVAKQAAEGQKVFATQDFRHLLDRKDADAVVIATPDHWHGLMTVWACEAGKDVYVEKPVSHNIWEGRQMIRAARKHGRIVQSGTQNRSDVGLQEAAALLLDASMTMTFEVGPFLGMSGS